MDGKNKDKNPAFTGEAVNIIYIIYISMKTKSIFLAGALCLAALSVQADVSEIDSLKLELSSLRQKGGDSRKMLEIYQNLSSIYETLNWDSSSYYLEKGMELYPYNPQIQISAESETKRSIFREKDKTKRSKKESAQHSKSRNKSFVMTSVSAL